MSETSPPRSRRRWFIAAAAVIFVVAAGLTVWFQQTTTALSRVEVLPQSLQCDGKPVPITLPDSDLFDDVAPRPTFENRIDVDSECWLTVAVANTGPRAVTIEAMTFPAMMPGPASGGLLETTADAFMSPPRDLDPDGEDSGDAVFTVDETVEAGAWTSLTYRIGYRPDGGTCLGVMARVSDFPVASVHVLGRSADVAGSVTIIHPSVKTSGNADCNLDE